MSLVGHNKMKYNVMKRGNNDILFFPLHFVTISLDVT